MLGSKAAWTLNLIISIYFFFPSLCFTWMPFIYSSSLTFSSAVVQSAVSPIQWIFHFQPYSFPPSVDLFFVCLFKYIFCFFPQVFPSLVSSVFLHLSKHFYDGCFNICVILVFIDYLFSFKLRFSWYDKWFFDWNLDKSSRFALYMMSRVFSCPQRMNERRYFYSIFLKAEVFELIFTYGMR